MYNISINNINNQIKGYLNDENFEQDKIGELKDFIDKNLRTILQQTEDSREAKNLQTKLLDLSNKINKEINTPQAHELSFNIMGIALGLLSDRKNNYLQDEIPSDVFSVILNNLSSNNLATDIKFLKSTERTSKEWLKEVNAHILRRINEENLPLSFVGCKTASEAINYIIKNKLQSANLSHFPYITDGDLKKLIENCPDLHTLFLRFIKINEVPFEKLPALQSLNLRQCVQLSEDKLAEALSKLTSLKNLNLSGCEQLSGNKLAEALGKLTALQSLDLGWCTQLSGDTLIEVLGKLTALKSLDLAGCKQLSEDKLTEALGKLAALNSLALGGCTQLSEDKLAEVLGKLKALKSLDLYNCGQLSGDKLAETLGKLTTLESLNLSRSSQLSGGKLHEALGKLTGLKSLVLWGWRQVWDDKLIETLGKLEARGVRIYS